MRRSRDPTLRACRCENFEELLITITPEKRWGSTLRLSPLVQATQAKPGVRICIVVMMATPAATSTSNS
jgi:hypothetical protein